MNALSARHPKNRYASVQWLLDPVNGERLDQALILRFDGPGSFTGENVVEFHLHGSVAVSDAVLSVLRRLPGFRDAEPGEFTRRALIHGKLGLSEVEGVGDLLEAETAAQRRLALSLMAGDLAAVAQAWRSDLVRSLAMIETSIDFADEDLPPDVLSDVRGLLDRTALAMESEARGSRAAERVRDGFEIAIVGIPNTGKSTLLNRLAGREAALTSDTAGTTRDVIEVRMDLGGLPVTFLDMAGLRDASDRIEALGVDRARKRAGEADMRIFLLEHPSDSAGLGVEFVAGDLVARPKGDLLTASDGALHVSGLTGAGLDDLLSGVETELSGRAALAGSASRERHRLAIGEASEATRAAAAVLDDVVPTVELAALEITRALAAIDFLIGKVDIESVLDEIFKSFCIGK